MFRIRSIVCSLTAAAGLLLAGSVFAQDRFGNVSDQVNKKMVKLFGAGGFKGLAAYGTGMIVSPDGYVLTVASHILDTTDLRVHLSDGRRFDNVKVVAIEPVLDVALIKLDGVKDLPYFDISASASKPLAQTGDWILAFSNQFQIATRDEPMSVMRGTIQSFTKLQGRRGVFEASYNGDVYVIDAITNNPGAGGGALTNRKGELLGIIGKELRNTQSDTWINYAMPLQAKIEVQLENEKKSVSLVEFVEKTLKDGKWQRLDVLVIKGGQKGETGIRLVQDVVERTPPYVDVVLPNSTAAKAGVKPDDLIVYINGEQVPSVKFYNEIMGKFSPGSKLVVEVRRGDKLKTVELEVVPPTGKLVPKK
ncbi:MAG: trypsin-like peptidase domain-containing protein [Planctomycetia bacterium]|nr:trypsin-like peptidase domain-containing protein [Planctomycetia bacterium]